MRFLSKTGGFIKNCLFPKGTKVFHSNLQTTDATRKEIGKAYDLFYSIFSLLLSGSPREVHSFSGVRDNTPLFRTCFNEL